MRQDPQKVLSLLEPVLEAPFFKCLSRLQFSYVVISSFGKALERVILPDITDAPWNPAFNVDTLRTSPLTTSIPWARSALPSVSGVLWTTARISHS
ncbi:hypothetical protein B0O99DRAFT_701314 [Bisporella sp. PMI_857]|nr:hypothetical protein B0O99DRAFT_701314 [Bisporella sp. PMI_857]